jgi:hypothetical protein
MSELSDYRRCVEAPMIENYVATIKSLRAERDAAREEVKRVRAALEQRCVELADALAGRNAESPSWRIVLADAERFIAGFEGDPLQEGIADLLTRIRALIK